MEMLFVCRNIVQKAVIQLKRVRDQMYQKEIEYIDFDEFLNNFGVKKSTIERKYKRIPRLINTENPVLKLQ